MNCFELNNIRGFKEITQKNKFKQRKLEFSWFICCITQIEIIPQKTIIKKSL